MLEPGDTILGAYVLDRRLGSRPVVSTWRATGTDGKRYIVNAASVRDAGSWEQLESFERLAKALAKTDHPNLPSRVGFYTEERRSEVCYYLISRFVNGESVEEIVSRTGPLPYRVVLELVRSVLGALTALHEHGPPVIHGDVHPSNVIRTRKGRIYLVGCIPSWDRETRLGLSGDVFAERRGYIPYEQLADRPVAASDLYALGMTAVFAVSGKHPYRLPERNLIPLYHGPRDRRPLFRVVDRMVAPEVRDRRFSAMDLLRFLDRAEAPPQERLRESFRRATWADSPGSSRRAGRFGSTVILQDLLDRRELIVGNPEADSPESLAARAALDLWVKRPWLVMLIAAVLTGGPGLIPFLVVQLHPRGGSWVNRALSRVADTRITVTDSHLSAGRQLPQLRLDDIQRTNLVRTQTTRGLRLEIIVTRKNGAHSSIVLSNLSRTDADEVEAFFRDVLASCR